MAWRRYGNTSSGSLWYALSYIEACQGVRKGEVVWQVQSSCCACHLLSCKPYGCLAIRRNGCTGTLVSFMGKSAFKPSDLGYPFVTEPWQFILNAHASPVLLATTWITNFCDCLYDM